MEEVKKLNILGNSLVGLTVTHASLKYKILRISKRDGKSYMGTSDLNFERMNIEIEDNIVTKFCGVF